MKPKTTSPGACPPHALFPRTDDDDAPLPDISWIEVRRQEAGGWRVSPTMHQSEDLPDASALFERYGGGIYDLLGRCADRSRITARVHIALAGEPKPLAPVPTPTVAPMPAPMPSGGTDSSLAAVLAMFGHMMQAQIASQQSMTQVLVAALGSRNNDSSTAPLVELIRQQGAQTAELIRANASRAPGAGGELEAHMKGLELGLDLAKTAASDEPAGDDILQTVGQVMQGAAMFANAPRPPGAPPPAMPMPPRPPAPAPATPPPGPAQPPPRGTP